MEKLINIPDEIEVNIDNFKVSVKGPNGDLERDFFSPLFKNPYSEYLQIAIFA